MCSRPATRAHLEILMWPLFALLSSSSLNNNSHIQLKLMWNILASAWNECNANLMSFCSTNRNGSQKTNSQAITQSDAEYTYNTVGRDRAAERPYKGYSLFAWHGSLASEKQIVVLSVVVNFDPYSGWCPVSLSPLKNQCNCCVFTVNIWHWDYTYGWVARMLENLDWGLSNRAWEVLEKGFCVLARTH